MSTFLRNRFLLVLLCCTCLVLMGEAVAPKNEITRTEYFLGKPEEKVERVQGQSFRLGYEENEALKRIHPHLRG